MRGLVNFQNVTRQGAGPNGKNWQSTTQVQGTKSSDDGTWQTTTQTTGDKPPRKGAAAAHEAGVAGASEGSTTNPREAHGGVRKSAPSDDGGTSDKSGTPAKTGAGKHRAHAEE